MHLTVNKDNLFRQRMARVRSCDCDPDLVLRGRKTHVKIDEERQLVEILALGTASDLYSSGPQTKSETRKLTDISSNSKIVISNAEHPGSTTHHDKDDDDITATNNADLSLDALSKLCRIPDEAERQD